MIPLLLLQIHPNLYTRLGTHVSNTISYKRILYITHERILIIIIITIIIIIIIIIIINSTHMNLFEKYTSVRLCMHHLGFSGTL